MANLVIVESPFKAGPIKSYLGSNYKVIASVGHVRDLPKSTLGIDIEHDFEPHYINIRGKGDVIKQIKKEAKSAGKIYLATDPDREGEAIAWHLAVTLGIPVEKTLRITYNEVTKSAIKAAIKQPRQINMDLVNAQQARRIMDRVVGYTLSPLLWKNVKSGLSAGRVQSVATRVIVEREEEIRAFVPEEYWTIEATLLNGQGIPFKVRFYGDINEKLKIDRESMAKAIAEKAGSGTFNVVTVKKGTRKKIPAPPFTTSTMQQEASRKLGFQSQRIMRVAQELYEGINLGSELGGVQGLITYMRTDSLRISAEAQESAKSFIGQKYGDAYAQEKPRQYKTKANSQDAHEAIRPARIELEPAMVRKHLSMDQYRLYKLIWERYVASQMEAAVLNTVSADFDASGYLFRTSGYTVEFPGYMAVYEASDEETSGGSDDDLEVKDIRMPAIAEGEKLVCSGIDPAQHFTEAPPHYNEASLIKFLEEKGIGRPSTYSQIITTIIGRNYVSRDGKSLVPTELGNVTTKLMKEHFPDIVDYKFTADMETELDRIENGELNTTDVLHDFWQDFNEELSKAEKDINSTDYQLPVETTDMICEKCGANMVVKNGRFGKFAACPNYPTCKNTKPLIAPNQIDAGNITPVENMKCEKCGADMVLRNGRYGSFYACSKYPDCKFTKPCTKELDNVKCPKCGAKIVMKYGRSKTTFYSCERYPACDFSSWDMPVSELCPQCGRTLYQKKGKPLLVCHEKSCGYKRIIENTGDIEAETADLKENNEQ